MLRVVRSATELVRKPGNTRRGSTPSETFLVVCYFKAFKNVCNYLFKKIAAKTFGH